MALVYQLDIAPHQKRLMAIRSKRLERWHRLHAHDGRATFWLTIIPALVLFWAAIGYAIDQMV